MGTSTATKVGKGIFLTILIFAFLQTSEVVAGQAPLTPEPPAPSPQGAEPFFFALGLLFGVAIGFFVPTAVKRAKKTKPTEFKVSSGSCPACGAQVPANKKFCTSCGKSVG